ncbi:mucin-2-like [Palaemon carinicauda]|uniref:mucin-2-like n=1 Tax=Palaemon carinicauda TaxID=392227 RepID=UPI0035B622B1
MLGMTDFPTDFIALQTAREQTANTTSTHAKRSPTHTPRTPSPIKFTSPTNSPTVTQPKKPTPSSSAPVTHTPITSHSLKEFLNLPSSTIISKSSASRPSKCPPNIDSNPPANEPNTTTCNNQNTQVNVLQWNICGLRNKFTFLQSQTSVQDPDIIILQETLLNENIPFAFSGYKVYTTYLSPTTRGLTTFVKSSIPSKLLPSIDCGTEAETLSVQISLLTTTLTVHNIYNSPAKSINAEPLFTAASDDSIIADDFNAHHQFLNSI